MMHCLAVIVMRMQLLGTVLPDGTQALSQLRVPPEAEAYVQTS